MPKKSRLKTVSGKSDRERELEKAMDELKKVLAPDTSDIAVANRCVRMNELSAAGKFLQNGIDEARKAVGKIETAVNRMVSGFEGMLRANDEQIDYLQAAADGDSTT